jgi:hypothetical protein
VGNLIWRFTLLDVNRLEYVMGRDGMGWEIKVL